MKIVMRTGGVKSYSVTCDNEGVKNTQKVLAICPIFKLNRFWDNVSVVSVGSALGYEYDHLFDLSSKVTREQGSRLYDLYAMLSRGTFRDILGVIEGRIQSGRISKVARYSSRRSLTS
jgi:hypothetical protein